MWWTMGKNIVVFSDGTGEEGGRGNNTNVYKLFNLALDRSARQIAFYDRGLGTGWRKATGNISGMGISHNIRACYEFIFENYEAGDEIYLFGFSRGATTVRSLSGFIHHFGILPKARPELIKEAYKIYKMSDLNELESAAKAFVSRHHTMWCRIKFLGVWDTVVALGVPLKLLNVVIDKIWFLKHSFHNLQLSESVANAYQALAIDDERMIFHPQLWDAEIAEDQSMKQVWFGGMHSDVGGGYSEHGLSDIALQCMIQMAEENGLLIYPDHKVEFSPNPEGTMHDSRDSLPKSLLYRRKVRSWPTKTHGKPLIHESVLKRTLNRHNESEPPYKPWILDGSYEYEIDSRKKMD